MAQQFKNNARALLTASITNTATTIVIEATKADLFPIANVGTGSLPSTSDWFKVTLQDSSGNVEIVAVRTRTAGSGIFSNVIRGYDGTTALAFVSGTVAGLRITAEDVQEALDLPNANSVFTGDNSFSGTNEFTGTQTFSGVTSFSDSTEFNDDVTFNSSPEVPTPTAGDSSAKAASTEFVQLALRAVYPVGSIYINAGATTNPATLLGFGTWTAFGAGRVMVGLNGSDALFDALEETGGSKDAIVVSHTHTFSGTTDSAGSHAHEQRWGQGAGTTGDYRGNSFFAFSTYSANGQTGVNGEHAHTYSGTTASTGSSGTNANLQPYITVAMWKRTA
jgi:hypothetical protein